MSKYLNDCEAEEALFRDRDGADRNAREIIRSTMKKIRMVLPDDETLQRLWNDFYQEHVGRPPDYQVTRQDILIWADQHPSRRTTDLELLRQRYIFDKEEFGKISREIKPPHTKPPIQSVFTCKQSRDVRRTNLQRKKMQEATDGYF